MARDDWRAGYDAWKTRAPSMPSSDRGSAGDPYRCVEASCAGRSFRGAEALKHYRATGHALRGRSWPEGWPNAQFEMHAGTRQ